jgi:hypothetical protein
MKEHSSITIFWWRLALHIALTAILALSIHVVMLDVLAIPHPDITHVSTRAIFLNDALSVTATFVIYRLAPLFAARPFFLRCLLLTAVYAMLKEALFRNFIMDGVVSHAWRYSLVENLAQPVMYLIICSMIVLLASRLRSTAQIIAAGIAVTAVTSLLIDPLISGAFGKLVASIEYLDTGNIYNPPYGWQVNVPSYIRFLEPVLASFFIAAVVWDKLSPAPTRRIVQFVLLVMAMKGSILTTLIYSFYQGRSLPAAFLSESQFGIEILVMTLLTAVGWQLSHRRSKLATLREYFDKSVSMPICISSSCYHVLPLHRQKGETR